MRTNSLIRALAVVAMLAAACSKSEEVDPTNPNVSVPDPEGTVTLSMRNANSGKTYLDNTNIYIDKADNFTGGQFVSLGTVKGLGNVSYIPKSGWISQTAVVPGEGYVAYASGRFYRIYVVRNTTNIAHEIIGAEINYQTPFGGADEAIALPEKSITFESEGGEKELMFTNKSIIPCTLQPEGFDGCGATWIYANGNSFLPAGIRISAAPNTSTQEFKGKVVLTATNGKVTELSVTRKGSAPYLDLGENLSFDCAAASQELVFQSNIPDSELIVTSSADWCKVTYLGEYILTLSVDENGTAEDRTATVTVASKDGKLKSEMIVSQEKLDFMLPQTIVDFDRKAQNTLLVISPTEFTYTATSSNENWCTLSWNKSNLTIRVSDNTTNANRSAKITVAIGKVTKTIQVNQSRYAVGDYYNENKIEGVVFFLDGFHGKIISMDEGTELCWSTEQVATGATDIDNGMFNVNVIKKIPNWKTLYPAFAWCDAKNTNGVTGWYLPAEKELLTVYENGFDAINATLQAKEKEPLQWNCWSSTEKDNSTAFYGWNSKADKVIQIKVRAVAAF